MKGKKIIKRVGNKVPFAKKYVQHKHLSTLTKIQNDEIIGLKEAVKRLEDRNEEWAAEVRMLRQQDKPLTIVWPVNPKDIVNADWTKKKQSTKERTRSAPPFKIAWVVPPMGQGSGGHTDIFRTIHYLESKGHVCTVYFYDALNTSNLETIQTNLAHYAPLKAEIHYNQAIDGECDAIFATNWFTAYPVFNYSGNAKKYYYVQDFEPYFEPVGTYSTLAENTYRFGFRGLTLGSWLSEKLSQEYGMVCDYFELGTDTKEYRLINNKPRKKILFYARPVTPRRGFELGVLALEIFNKEHPEYEIHFLGWDTKRYEISFPYVNHGILSISELNELYNQCAAGLVLSYTNMSLLPLEMLSAGCIPVMNDSYHTRKVSYEKYLRYSPSTPQALADALYEAVSSNDQVVTSRLASEYAASFKWEDSNKIIEDILIKELS